MLILLSPTAVAPVISTTTSNESVAVDPRPSRPNLLISPRPLSPPGSVPDGWGHFRPILAKILVPLAPAQAAALLSQGVPFAHAHVYP